MYEHNAIRLSKLLLTLLCAITVGSSCALDSSRVFPTGIPTEIRSIIASRAPNEIPASAPSSTKANYQQAVPSLGTNSPSYTPTIISSRPSDKLIGVRNAHPTAKPSLDVSRVSPTGIPTEMRAIITSKAPHCESSEVPTTQQGQETPKYPSVSKNTIIHEQIPASITVKSPNWTYSEVITASSSSVTERYQRQGVNNPNSTPNLISGDKVTGLLKYPTAYITEESSQLVPTTMPTTIASKAPSWMPNKENSTATIVKKKIQEIAIHHTKLSTSSGR